MEKDFSREVLEKIKKERIVPKSRWHFLLRDYVVWLIFGISIVFGALAFSVILHFWGINDWDAYYRVNNSFLAFTILTMPYFWLVCFAVFVSLAYLYLRYTRTGYRYEFTNIIIFNLSLSFIFGAVLYSLGAGSEVESGMAEHAPFYKEVRKRQESVWLKPENGVIIGRIIEIAESGEILKLDDPSRDVWTVETGGAEYKKGFIVKEGFVIRVFGEEKGKNYFIADKVRPLRKEKSPRFSTPMQGR